MLLGPLQGGSSGLLHLLEGGWKRYYQDIALNFLFLD